MAAAMLERNAVLHGYRIRYLGNFFVEPVYKRIFDEHGVSSAEYVVIFSLMHAPGMSAQDISEFSGRPKNSISRAVHGLMRKKYLVRSVSAADRRRRLLQPTPKGRQLYERTLPLFHMREQQMLAVLSPAELKVLDRLLAKLVLREDGWANPY
jgi:DNA-binding MarR family transcriptional regulator